MSERSGGLLVPVFSVRREGDPGIGDVVGLRDWVDMAAEHGVGFLQLLPINEMGSDESPYNAISSVALDPIYLAMDEVPGLRRSDLKSFGGAKGGDVVDYPRVRRVKRDLLEIAWGRWGAVGSKMRSAFDGFCEDEAGWLKDYCVFRALIEAAGTEAWERWPESWRNPGGARRAAGRKPERLEFYAWVQWLCFRQWRELRKHASERGLRLMGDIPIGVSRNSADVFFNRGDFNLEWCGGAPPEKMFKHDRFIRKWGQNWGIPLYRWDRMEAADFPWWRRRISKLTEIFDIFRIDHVLGFYRIYAFPWQPGRNAEFLKLTRKQAAELTGGELPGWSPRPDKGARNRDLNRADGDRRLRAVIEAAGGAEVVGEDLGHVPEYVRPHLQSLGVAGFRVPHWDFDAAGQVVKGGAFPECSFATYATHDHDPLAAMWEDFRLKKAAGSGEAGKNLKALAAFARIRDETPYKESIQWKLIEALMASRSRYAAILVNDLWRGVERINSPGTVGAGNWTYRIPFATTEARGIKEWGKLAEILARTGRS